MIISRYLGREVLQAAVVVTAVLLLALLSQQMVRYLNYVAIGKIATNVLIQLVSFEIPYLLALLLPLGLYLGVLIAYGRLYTDNEMLILQMSGFGIRRLTRLTAFIASMLGLFVLVLMLWVNPWISAKRQEVMQSDEATVHLVQTMIPGRFQASPDGKDVMYVERLSLDRQKAENVFLAQIKSNPDQSASDTEQQSWMLVFANQGYQMRDKETQDLFFVTMDGYRYEGRPGDNDYKIIQFKKYAVRIPQADIRVAHPESEGMSTPQLWHEYHDPKRAGELQWRFSIAIATVLLALLAVPLSQVKPRRGRFVMILPAVLVYIIYINLLFIARRWVEQGVVPVYVGMWWVHLLMLLLIVIVAILRSGVRQTSS